MDVYQYTHDVTGFGAYSTPTWDVYEAQWQIPCLNALRPVSSPLNFPGNFPGNFPLASFGAPSPVQPPFPFPAPEIVPIIRLPEPAIRTEDYVLPSDDEVDEERANVISPPPLTRPRTKTHPKNCDKSARQCFLCGRVRPWKRGLWRKASMQGGAPSGWPSDNSAWLDHACWAYARRHPGCTPAQRQMACKTKNVRRFQKVIKEDDAPALHIKIESPAETSDEDEER